MAIQDILKKILDEAETAVAVIQADCEKEEKQLKERSAKIEQSEVANIEAKFDDAVDVLDRKNKTMASRDNAKALLTAKQGIIKEAMEKLCESLENADDKLYSSVLEKLFAKFPFSAGKVVIPAKRMAITEKFIPSGFELKTSDEIKGGFIAYTDGAEVDCTFRTLVFSEFASEIGAYFAEKLKLL